MTEPEQTQERPRASVIEIIAKGHQPTEDGPGSIIIPREVRINGTPVYTADRDNRIKVSDIQLGDDMVTVTLTLVARKVVIAADGDLDEEQNAPVDWQAIAEQRERELKRVGEARQQAEGAVQELAQAIRLTREYVGEDVLPAIEGWSWYDALCRWAPHELTPEQP